MGAQIGAFAGNASCNAAATGDGVILQDGGRILRLRVSRGGQIVIDAATRTRRQHVAQLLPFIAAWALLPELVVRSLAWFTGAPDAFVGGWPVALGGVIVGQWLAGIALWGSPALYGALARKTGVGLQRLQWHGAEHLVLGSGELLDPACGSAVHSRAAALHTMAMIFIAVFVVLAGPAHAAALCLIIRVPTAVAALWLGATGAGRFGELDWASSWLQTQLVARPTAAQLDACHMLAAAARQTDDRLRFSPQIATPAAVGGVRRDFVHTGATAAVPGKG